MNCNVETTTRLEPKTGYMPGVPLEVLMNYLIELQASGVPEDAEIQIKNQIVTVTWVEDR